MGHKILHFPHTFTVIFANFFSKQDGAKSSEKVHSHADFLSILFLVFRHSIVHSAAVLLSSVWLWLRSQELQRRHQETWVFVTLIFFSLLTAYAQKQLQEPIVIILDIAKTESNNCLYTVGGYLWHFIYQQFGGRPQNCYTDRIFFFTFQFRSNYAGLRHFTPLCTRLFPKFWIPTVILKWIFQNCSVLSSFSVYKPGVRAYCGSLLAKRSETSKIKWFLIGLSEVIQLHSVIGWNGTARVLFLLSATIFGFSQSDSTI